jgi:polyisoprenoid-binding protein YceI
MNGTKSITWFALAAVLFVGPAPALAAAETYNVDAVHSSIVFRVIHLGVGAFWGRFNDISGTFVFDDVEPANNAIDITVKTESVDTNNEGRDRHLKSPDFFDARQFPKITFKSKKVTKKDGNEYEAVGELTLHGVTRETTVRFERIGTGSDPRSGAQRTGFEAAFTIKRSDFDMNYMLNGLSDEVRVIVGVEGIQQK